MILKNVNVRPMRPEDIPAFEAFRRSYWDGDLELPKGWGGQGWETAVAEGEGGHPIASLTGSLAAVLDPLIRNPHVRSGPELVASIYALERTLAYNCQKHGAIDAYIAIPDHLTDYHEIVRKAGYEETLHNCKVFRRPLRPDTHPLIGPELEARRREMLAQMEAAQVDTGIMGTEEQEHEHITEAESSSNQPPSAEHDQSQGGDGHGDGLDSEPRVRSLRRSNLRTKKGERLGQASSGER